MRSIVVKLLKFPPAWRRAVAARLARALSVAAVLAPAVAGAAPAAADWVGRFAPAGGPLPSPWRIEQFDARVAATRFRTLEWDGVPALEATASRSMAVLVRPLQVDLARAPVLCWRWRVDASVAGADPRTKQGDDYAARIYLMYRVAGEQLDFALRTRLALARALRGEQVPDAAINYVWDHHSPVGTVLPNAYTDRAMIWVLRSGDAEARQWVSERRDVRADFRRAFGYEPAQLYALGLASDTDNTGGEARAGFAELHFVPADQACE